MQDVPCLLLLVEAGCKGGHTQTSEAEMVKIYLRLISECKVMEWVYILMSRQQRLPERSHVETINVRRPFDNCY